MSPPARGSAFGGVSASHSNRNRNDRLPPRATDSRMPPAVLAALKTEATIAVNHEPQAVQAASQQSFWHVHWHALSVLKNFLSQDPSVHAAYFAAEPLHHFRDTDAAHGFCGYRNMQVILHSCLTRITAVDFSRRPAVSGGFAPSTVDTLQAHVPNIIGLQHLVEAATRRPFILPARSSGAVTLELVGTRKWVGTPELAMVLGYLRIPFAVSRMEPLQHRQACRDGPFDGQACTAYDHLMVKIAEHFCSGPARALDLSPKDGKVFSTSKPPLYLQWAGHSVTVVGVCLRSRPHPPPRRGLLSRLFRPPSSATSDGQATLPPEPELEWRALVFDPAVRSSGPLHRAVRDGLWTADVREAERVFANYSLDVRRDGSHAVFEVVEVLL